MRRWLRRSGALVLLWFVVACVIPRAAAAVCPDKGPALTAPAANAQQDPPITFQWIGVAGAVEYRLMVSKSDGFLLTRYLAETTLTLPLVPGNYKWRVDAMTPGCEGAPSETRDLTVSGQLCPDQNPKPTSPAIGERVSSPVTLSWTAVPNGSPYAVLLFKDGAQVAEKIVGQPTVTVDLPAGGYDWIVQTRTPTCPVLHSPFAFFVVSGAGQDCATEPAKLLSPELMAEVTSPVQLSWSEVRGATQYKVTLIHGGVETVKTTTETKISVDLAAGGYDWRVESSAPGCKTLVSPTSFFRLICHKGAPQLISPASGAQATSPVEFKWSGSAEAKNYVLLVRLNGQLFTEMPVTGTSQTLNLPNGEFEWSVMAIYEGCPGEESARGTFRIGGSECSSAGPTLVLPDHQAVLTTLPVTFQWSAVQGAFAYQLLLAPADGPLEPLKQTNETSVKLSLPPGRYRWGVLALRDGCPPVESSTRTFTVPEKVSGTCADAVPTLVTPADGSALQPPVDFSWTSIQGAVEYVVFIVRPDGTATPVASTDGGTTTLHVDWLPVSKAKWFVAALVPGCHPLESSRSSFEITQIPGCPEGRPFTLLPPDGAENVPAHLRFEWTPLPGATAYQLWTSVDEGQFQKNGSEVTEPSIETDVQAGRVRWFVAAKIGGCPAVTSERAFFTAVAQSSACGLSARPALAGAAAVLSGEKYTLRWSPVPGAASYEVQEDTSERFTSPTSKKVTGTSVEGQRSATTPTPYAYRVRAIDSCQQPGPFSLPVHVIVEPKPLSSAAELSLFADISRSDKLTQDIFIPGSGSHLEAINATRGRRRAVSPHPPSTSSGTFTATTDAPWLKLTPSSGELPAAGITIKASVDPALLPAGTSRGVVKITRSGISPLTGNGTTGSAGTVVTVSKVTPVTPSSGSSTARDAILIPLVTDGSTTTSALAVSNLSSSPRKYELTFIPTDVDGTKEAKTTSIQVEPGDTALLDQVLRSWFGAVPGQTTQGSIQIRPLDSETSTISKGPLTVASALLSSTVAAGALQAFVPQIPLSSFVQSGTTGGKLILPDVRTSEAWSTAIGLMEGGGQAATAKVTVYNSSNTVVAQQNVELRAREETLLDDLLSSVTVSGGRAEVELGSSAGKISAFTHTNDTRSSDEVIVPPVVAADVSSGHQLIAQAMNYTDTNGRKETTDIWLYNPSSSAVPLTLTLYPEGGSSEKASIGFTLAAGETKLLEDVIGKSFQSDEDRGMIDVDPGSASVIVSARNIQSGPGGTYSTPLTPVSTTDGVATGERTLQILHGRASDQFQMDLTLVELSGKSATVEIMAVVPDTKVTPVTTVTLAANEIKRISPILGTLGLTDVYNARITVRVTSGDGRVWAEGTLIDLVTGDRSVIPAE